MTLEEIYDMFEKDAKFDRTELGDESLSEEEYKRRGWEPNPLRILKSDVPMYIDSDNDLGEIDMKIEYQKEKINALEGIIKHLSARGFQIKAAIDWEKFKAGI